MKQAVCICASNMAGSGSASISLRLCEHIARLAGELGTPCEILDLRQDALSPCTGCGACFPGRRCAHDRDFNRIYEKLASSCALFLVSPHYAPIPAKLCMLLEKREEITFLPWWRDNSYRSELSGLPTSIVSHGSGGEWRGRATKPW